MGFLLRFVIFIGLFWILPGLTAGAESGAVGRVEGSDLPMKSMPSLIASVHFDGPMEFCGKKVPLDRQEIRERLEKEVLLFLWNRSQVILWLKRAPRYFPHIQDVLKKEGLPDDLKYAAVVESGLRPHAGSSKGAVGFWQFLRSTGRRYGLRVDSMVDERRNLFSSTRAACKYLKDLHGRFDSWLLALAAYNMGEKGLETEMDLQANSDYFSLYLPLETQRYIFKIIAARMIMENPGRYGFDLEAGDTYPRMEFDRVNLDSPSRIPLRIIAEAAGTSFKKIKDMNPEIRGYHLSKGKTSVLIPRGRAKGFKTSFSSLMAKWNRKNFSKIHVVKNGENLSQIAGRYQISLSSLLRWNNLRMNSFIHPGDRLVVKTN